MKLSSPLFHRPPSHPRFLLASVTAFTLVGCGVELTQGNSEPFIVSVGPLLRSDNMNVDIFFSIADFQNDDAKIEVQICTSDTSCSVAVASNHYGHGSSRLSPIGPEQNKYSATHRFSWKVPCGLLNTENGSTSTLPLDTPFWATVRVVTSDNPLSKSPKYTLQKLGITQLPKQNCSS